MHKGVELFCNWKDITELSDRTFEILEAAGAKRAIVMTQAALNVPRLRSRVHTFVERCKAQSIAVSLCTGPQILEYDAPLTIRDNLVSLCRETGSTPMLDAEPSGPLKTQKHWSAETLAPWLEVHDMQFLRRYTDRTAKITLPGPFTMAQQAQNEFYRDREEMTMDFAAAVNAEARELEAAGSDVIQLDEPWIRNDPEAAARYAVPAINRALEGIRVPTAVHLCFGYAAVVKQQKPTGYAFLPQLADSIAAQISIEAAQPRLDLGILKELAPKTVILGVIDLADPAGETAEQVAGRIRAALRHVPAERLIPAPDCGMKYLPRETAFGKLQALAEGARLVRAERSSGRTSRPRYTTARCTPPAPWGTPRAPSPISTAPSVPISIGALMWPMWAMRNARPLMPPIPTPRTTPHRWRQ